MAATALLLEPTQSTVSIESQALSDDWEAPAGGPSALPRIARLSFTYRGDGDDHLLGQPRLALEPLNPATETCLAAFGCGCRARVLQRLLEPR